MLRPQGPPESPLLVEARAVPCSIGDSACQSVSIRGPAVAVSQRRSEVCAADCPPAVCASFSVQMVNRQIEYRAKKAAKRDYPIGTAASIVY